jgi:type VI secretion system protein ImpK
MSDDPFAEPSDPDRTMIRPRPGGVRAAPADAPARAVQLGPGPELTAVPTIGTNPLVAIAAPLLAAAIRIATTGAGRNPDPDLLRRGLVAEVRRFEQNALATGLDTRPLRAARYALCATIDDLVLSTPWGASSTWSQQSLTSIFHTEVIGGDRFFDILEQMQKDLGRNGEVVELMYLCTSLGFEGRYRVMPRGVAALNELRDSVYRLIRNRRGDFERELSPHWRGLDMTHRPLGQRIPLWAVALGTLTLALLIYLGFNFALSNSSDIAYAELYGLPPHGAPTMVHVAVDYATPAAPTVPGRPPPPPPAAPVTPSAFTTCLNKFLEPEIKAGLVQVLQDAQAVTVRLTNRNMFASGQATLNSSYLSVIDRLGQAIQCEPGNIMVNGYTDNQPIHTPRFPSNFELSKARADTVADLIKAKLADKGRVTAVGKADADPLAPNTTPEGRQENRRTEIVLTRETHAP